MELTGVPLGNMLVAGHLLLEGGDNQDRDAPGVL